jgi:amyloid beta precursor protein binding protein 1
LVVQTPLLWYLALRAADLFYNKYARWPGAMDSALAGDQEEVFQLLRGLCLDQYHLDASLLEPPGPPLSPHSDSKMAVETEGEAEGGALGAEVLVRRAHAQEIVRYGGSELHNISAMVGGIASQEAVKIITHQFVPLNNTYVYNGIASCGATYAL